MRLLYLDDYGTPCLQNFFGDEIPLYAILSHTWGPKGSEVTYEDIVGGTAAERKAGYAKIQFCGEKAVSHGLKYFWVDTCCIDKSSSAELQEAINSMFRWYHNAARCYVYLSDVSILDRDLNSQIYQFLWESAFRTSRWFTRGWTLQELLAPPLVEFFSQEYTRLGDKSSLEQQIYEITEIAVPALQGTPLSRFGVQERFEWAKKRQTTCEEDWAYALLGIFDISMPLVYGEGRDKAVIRLKEEIERFSKHQASHHAPWIVPFERNSRFTGRECQLTELEEIYFTGDQTTKTAITGLGGVGKTQLALELVYQIRAKHRNCSIIWISATNKESLEQAYLDAAKQLGISGCEDYEADVKKLVRDYLSSESAGQWLVVFDNADDVNMWTGMSEPGSGRLIDYLPKSKQGSIIFTTRDRKTAVKLAHQNIVELSEMDENVATQLMQKCLVNQNLINSQGDTKVLLAQLTYLPLAIVQAAAYINENGIALGDYLSLLAEQEEDVIDLLSEEFEDEGRYRNVNNPVATTWLISFEQIRRRDPLAADYLSFMACIDPKDVPQSLLPPGQSRKKEIDAIGTLDAYSFITKRPVELALDIHQLVHLATRNWLRKNELLGYWTCRVIVRLAEVLANSGYHNRVIWRTYLPHASYALRSDLVDKNREDRTDLGWKYGICLYHDGRYNEAKMSFDQVIETRKRVLGIEHPDTLTSMSNLALTYLDQGRWKEAEELGVQVMATRKRVLGQEHPSTLASMSNLASTYQNQGRWKEAEKLGVQVMATRKRVLGQEHPSTLTSMGNLASTYRNQGRWKEAEELEVQVMATRKRVLGQEHPSTLASMSNLASTYQNQGRWKEAEKLGVQVIETSKRVLGQEHPSTLASMGNIASTYRNQGRWKEAEELEVQVMATRKRVLGQEHPDTLASMGNLASTYWNQGRWKEAEELEVQVMETSKRVLGQEHPSTLTSMGNLASTYRNQGRWKEAEELGVQVIETSKRVLGQEHPHTLTSMDNLASTYQNQGRWKEAEELEVQVMETFKRVLGQEHPSTLASMGNLASTYRNQGRWKEAEELEVQVMATRERVLGQEHPSTLTSMGNVALTYWNQGRWKEAEELGVQVMATRERVLGQEHPDTLNSMANLALTWKGQGRILEAIELMEECVQLRTLVLGADHPSTLSSSAALIGWETERL